MKVLLLRHSDYRRIELCAIRGEYVYVVTPTAKTAAQRKAAERARDQSAGIAEVRGIKAPIALHAAIKRAAQEVIAKGKK